MDGAGYKIDEGILFTDMYQFTMAQLYFRMGLHEKPVQFDHIFRNYPDYGNHQAGYCISAGLEWLLDWMDQAHFRDADIDFLRGQRSPSGKPNFSEDFLKWLRANGNFSGLRLSAIPEGRVIHPNEPITLVQGPLAMAQILETSLLNHLNYQILIATKAARIREVSGGQLLLEFGLRRAQGAAGNAGARAALIGGANFTSNVGLSALLNLPPKGTHAHSMVQLLLALGMTELDAFRAYAELYPEETLLLVDTINTLESGVPNAIRVFEELRQKGHRPVGVRLDSGDLAFLSIQTAKMLDAAGFPDVSIVLSNNLDELVIWQIITQIAQEAPRYGVDADRLAKRLVYGVGTHLITSWGAPALDGVYKLAAVENEGSWIPTIKLSESPTKTPVPGKKLVWRLYDQRGKATADLVTLEDEDPRHMQRIVLHHPNDSAKCRVLEQKDISEIEPLLTQVLNEGKRMNGVSSLDQMRAKRQADVERLDLGVRRIINPHIYHVSLTKNLWELKQRLIQEALPTEDGA